MARWRSDTDELKGLTEAESMLILPAARLCAALIYLAVNPGGDSLHYAGKTSSELQSVSDIFREYPSTQEAPHRIHPVLTIVGKRWRRAAREGRPPKLEDISLESVEKGCADLAKRHPNQPPVFYSADLSTLLDRIPKVQHWWKSKAKQGGGRSNKEKAKGKASIPADANSDVDPPPRGQLPRGTKRSAAAVAQSEEEPDEDDDREIETTPWKAGKTVHRVRFQSPDAPPKQRRRLEDDPDVEESDDEPVELWVARGEDRCDACKERNIRVCEPQWGAPRSSACKTCARKKQTCRSTRVWRNELANLFQCKPQGPLLDQAEVTLADVPARPAGGAPAIQVDDVPQSVEGTVAAGAGRRRVKGSNGCATRLPLYSTHADPSSAAPPVVDTNSRLSAIEASLAALNARLDRTDTDISAIKGHQEKQVESLAALERTQHDLKKMVFMLTNRPFCLYFVHRLTYCQIHKPLNLRELVDLLCAVRANCSIPSAGRPEIWDKARE
ncbi:hypothetical protein EDB84DRAFT_1609137 [Lactarius hengduanensis]|nr:hypothetical protein EDB84DRAFT_1609137 [Lactarius hengduanensis]